MMFKHEAFFWGKKTWWFVSVENPWWFSEVTHEESLSASTPSKGQFLEWFQGENSADLSCFLLDTTWPWRYQHKSFLGLGWVGFEWLNIWRYLKISEDIWRYLKIPMIPAYSKYCLHVNGIFLPGWHYEIAGAISCSQLGTLLPSVSGYTVSCIMVLTMHWKSQPLWSPFSKNSMFFQ